MTTAPVTHDIAIGNRNDTADKWIPFAWDDPIHGSQEKGEVIYIRPEGTSGTLQAGLWRTGRGIAGCEDDGTCHVYYSAPLGDETMVILEGTAEVTELATGKVVHLEAGSIISHPKGVDLHWHITSPFLKKVWVIWDSPQPATTDHSVYLGNISDNPQAWEPYQWVEPAEGEQTCGELFMLRNTGSTGTLMCGLWRTGVGLPGCAADGSSTVPYTAPLGDETMLILEGQAELTDEQTGTTYTLKAGDIIGLPSGRKTTWTSKAPFVKKFWVITNADLPTT